MSRWRIEVPATSANLGPGFDTLALAVDVVNRAEVEFVLDSADVTLRGSCADPYDNMLCRAYRSWGDETGSRLPGARFTIDARIPIARGLGSSAAMIVAGLAAAAVATGAAAPRDHILDMAARIEGHPDNVAAAVMGGATVAFLDDGAARAVRILDRAHLGVSIFVPDEPFLTSEARGCLPESVPLRDAVFDLGRLAGLTAALSRGRWELLGAAMEDRLHQPYRARLLPDLDGVIAAAREAGAHGASLSGAGPSVIALTPPEGASAVAQAMERRAAASGWKGRSITTRVRDQGLTMEKLV